ncbi:MAG TPA: hypothetical protein VKU38_06725 [Ktedonobacteraceae bacterium]|nr:hypothetical protein [Ktedonobacteraceae bacterium]
MHSFSKEAIERPFLTLQAAGVLRENAGAISHATTDAREGEIAIAVIQPDLSFGGVWLIARENLITQVSLVEDKGGWSFIFSSHTSIAQVEERCLEFMRIAFRRWKAMQRWVNRHA